MSTSLSTQFTVTLDERIESIVVEKLSAFAANQNDLLSRLQAPLQQKDSCLEEMLITSNAQQKIVQPGSINEVELMNVCNASQKILR